MAATVRERRLIVIPARLDSDRFPRKVLADIAGKPLLQWTWERACEALDPADVWVATDSEEIADAARTFGANACITSPDCRNGTERAAEVAASFPGLARIVNLQADEPCIPAKTLRTLVRCGLAPDTVGTAVQPMQTADVDNPHVVKVAVNSRHEAVWFSRRSFTPSPAHAHVGVYAFDPAVLARYRRLPVSPWEVSERLEQWRWLHWGGRFLVWYCEEAAPSVNVPADVPAVAGALLAA